MESNQKKQRQSSLFRKLITGLFLFFGVAICGTLVYRHNLSRNSVADQQADATARVNNTQENVSGNDAGEVSEEYSSLVAFGEYLQELYVEGRKTELENKVISRRLDMEEAALVSDRSQLLHYIRGYTENELAINTEGICILTADVNQDGLTDIIEYGPHHDLKLGEANRLIIYLGTQDDGFCLSYSQQTFDTGILWYDIIEVISYQGESYLLFQEKGLNGNLITAYWLYEGIPQGKLVFQYECTDMEVTVTENTDGCNIDWFLERAKDIWEPTWYRYADGEVEIENREEVEALEQKYWDKCNAERQPYLEQYGDRIYTGLRVANYAYESDLNNDGINERYVKVVNDLCMYEKGFGDSFGLPLLTGEYYGNHEGRSGLTYYIETDGNTTDFQRMCGLDIWEGDMTPQYFYVIESEKGNITCIVYRDKNEHRQRIDGYLIQGDSYERAFSLWNTPKIDCTISYEVREEAEPVGVSYITYLSEDYLSVELQWDKEYGKEKIVNQSIREALEKRMASEDPQSGEFFAVEYWPIEATEEEFIMDCMIYYHYLWGNHTEEGHTNMFCLRADLMTGVCTEIEDR